MKALYSVLTRRYLLGRKGRTTLTLAGITLGVAMVAAVALTNTAILSSYQNLIASMAGRADLQVTAGSRLGFPADLQAQVAAVSGVRAAVPTVVNGSPVWLGQRQSNANFYGIDPNVDGRIRDYKFAAGRQVAGRGEVVLSDQLAAALVATAGDRVQLLSTAGLQEFTVVGILDARGSIRGAAGPFGVMNLEDASQIFGKAGKLDTLDIIKGDGVSTETVEKSIDTILAGRARVGTPMERTKDVEKLLDGITFSLVMAGSISLFAGVFIIYTNVAMGVAERRRDLSVLRALGLRRRELMTLVLREAGVLGLAGGALGLLLGYGLASTMGGQMTAGFLQVYGVQTAPVTVGLPDVLLALAVGVGAALFSAYGPARETAGFSPVEAMRPRESSIDERPKPAWLRVAVGLIAIAAAPAFYWATWPRDEMLAPLVLRAWGIMAVVALLGVVTVLPVVLPALNRIVLRPLAMLLSGTAGRLAADNAVRQPRRTTATISALMVSLTFMVATGGMSTGQRSAFDDWWRRSATWDLSVSTARPGSMTGQVELEPGVVRELAQIPGVQLATPQKFSPIQLSDGDPAYLYTFDHNDIAGRVELPMVEGSWPEALAALQQGGAVLVSPPVSRRLQVHPGDAIQLTTPTGQRSFRVVGVFRDTAPYGGTVQVDWKDYVHYWQDESATRVAIIAADKGQVEAIRRTITDRWGATRGFVVVSNHEYWAQIMSTMDAFYAMLNGLTWIAILVSGLALGNTLFAAVLERRRELGTLRAVGARQQDILRMVVGEALGTGVVGGVLGTVAGLALQILFVTSSDSINGIAIDLRIAWASMGLAVAVALLLAPLAGLVPARWAARLDVVEALRTE